ncbi:AraC family transcriptional regulator [Mucilaginibacter sp. SP1R1]|uniref:AraC family transcriptional regulator n=1 Tax=Mucilaginibacter sp. SP1R1 TaxID=2723091 RepID=UPI00160A551C|nr:AraC family transcriptional regulator [Mucilaginibacter sp. SP1R1]MBB6150157.1 AraC-like DNA-binding protein [Mucilaginibacter sp. SP1R1]
MVKPTLETLSSDSKNTFLVRLFEQHEFASPYHFHPEYELTAILKGEGNRFVGNHMSAYQQGDLVLIGGNVPHCWKTTLYDAEINAKSVVIQFRVDFLGANFFENQSAWKVVQLFKKSFHGIHFSGAGTTAIIDLMLAITKVNDPLKKLILLLDVLDHLTDHAAYSFLNEEPVICSPQAVEHQRLKIVQSFIIDNFRNKITLDQVAGIAIMTRNAFCKFYKKMTGKTLTEAITYYRLQYAMQQLLSTDKNATQICFDAGFNDVASFHKTFKLHTGESPLGYRKQHLGLINAVSVH